MSANPILAQFTRGNWVENIFRGSFCVADAKGNVLASAGDVEHPIFPRSAIKVMQALPVFTSGADKAFDFDDESFALSVSSHHGEKKHVEVAQRILRKAGLTTDDLECGAHAPTNVQARNELIAAGENFSALHNNCSGKHAAMLSVAKALNIDTKNYVSPDHEVQKRVRAAVEAVIGQDLTEHKCGTDGCSIPTWAAPLRAFATGFARLETGEGLSPEHAQAAKILFNAATSHSFLIAGANTFDTDVMKAFSGRLMIKMGADGVFCGALRDTGIGFALKCDDGNLPAAAAMIAGVLEAISYPNAKELEFLQTYSNKTVSNWNGIEVGVLQATQHTRPQF